MMSSGSSNNSKQFIATTSSLINNVNNNNSITPHQQSTVATNDWSLVGKTCLITGATRGLGYDTAVELAKRGAKRVILACRDVNQAKLAALSMRQLIGINAFSDQQQLAVVQLDLANLNSVRQCAQFLLQNERELHVLINNAGIRKQVETATSMRQEQQRQMTVDGYELFFQTNYLGHFLLTNLLLPLLQKSAPSRVVIVASDVYVFCSPLGIDLQDLNLEKTGKFTPFRAYCQSRLANILFARHLFHRVKHSGVSVFALHPGYVRLTVAVKWKSSSGAMVAPSTNSGELMLLSDANNEHAKKKRKTTASPPEHQQQQQQQPVKATPTFCACEPYLEQIYDGGCYFGEWPPDKNFTVLQIIQDDATAERLWLISEQMLSLK